MASKGDPTGLGYKGNHEIGQWRQEYKPIPLFLLHPPTNSCLEVPMTSKENYSTIPMKSHTFGVKRLIFKHTFIIDGQGTTWLAQVVEKNGTSSYMGAARGCWLPTEDHLGEKVSPIYTTHRWWVTQPMA